MEEKNKKQSVDQVVKEIKRRTRRKFTAEEKLRLFWKVCAKACSVDHI
jgi:hypothetical protein